MLELQGILIGTAFLLTILHLFFKKLILQLLASVGWSCAAIAVIADTETYKGKNFILALWGVILVLHLFSIHSTFKKLTAPVEEEDEKTNSNKTL